MSGLRRLALGFTLALALALGAGCGTGTPESPLDPDESRSDARIEGVWERADGLVLLLNDDGSLRVEGAAPLEGERWDRFSDSLTLYVQPTGEGPVTEETYRVDALTPRHLTLAPSEPHGGRFARQIPTP